MNVLVIGSGGREHALVWKLSQSPAVKKIYCSPGNGGISQIAEILPAEKSAEGYIQLAKSKKIDLTVVGPEVPLCDGLVDAFEKAGLRAFGPVKSAARFEGSKIFSKNFMKKYGIPTANFATFEDADKALAFLKDPNAAIEAPCVVKADGLAAGKGVSVCDTAEEAIAAVEQMMVKKVFGAAGEKIVIEERLAGDELSLLALCDGKTIRALPTARDYKRVFDDNKGPNTGGMGAISPVAVPPALLAEIERKVVQPFLTGIRAEKIDYRGVIYFGIMLTAQGPYVLEYNVRFGDPETQVVLPLLKSDLVELFNAVIDRRLDQVKFETHPETCVGVVCASGGYPGSYDSHKEISGTEALPNNGSSFLFHAGTSKEGTKIFTNGGRVLNVVAKGANAAEARKKCYEAVAKVRFDGMHYRKDIAANL